MSPKSILIVTLMGFAAQGCQCPTVNTSTSGGDVEPTLRVSLEDASSITPYIDQLLNVRNQVRRSPASTSEDTVITDTVRAQPPRPQSRSRPHRERHIEPKPIRLNESASLTELATMPQPKPVVTLRIIIPTPIVQQVVAPPAVTASVAPPQLISQPVELPPLSSVPVAAKRELSATPTMVKTAASPAATEWPRKLGAFRLQCGHPATLWLLGPDRAVITSEPSCSCGSFNVEVGSTPHANTRIAGSYAGEGGWTLRYCDTCGKYFLNRQ